MAEWAKLERRHARVYDTWPGSHPQAKAFLTAKGRLCSLSTSLTPSSPVKVYHIDFPSTCRRCIASDDFPQGVRLVCMGKRQLEDSSTAQPAEPSAKQAKVSEDAGVSVTSGPQVIEVGGKSCQHEVAWPGRVQDEKAFQPPVRSSQPPAKQYPFALDPFQQTAINCLEAGELRLSTPLLAQSLLSCSCTCQQTVRSQVIPCWSQHIRQQGRL